MTDLTQDIANLVRPYMEEMTEATMVARDVLAVIEAHLRPVVATVAELNALPVESVIRSEQGGIWEKAGFEGATLGPVINVWYEPGSRIDHESRDIALPATVLFRPAD